MRAPRGEDSRDDIAYSGIGKRAVAVSGEGSQRAVVVEQERSGGRARDALPEPLDGETGTQDAHAQSSGRVLDSRARRPRFELSNAEVVESPAGVRSISCSRPWPAGIGYRDAPIII